MCARRHASNPPDGKNNVTTSFDRIITSSRLSEEFSCEAAGLTKSEKIELADRRLALQFPYFWRLTGWGENLTLVPFDKGSSLVLFRPGGPIENSPRREPWGRGHPPLAQPRQGRQRLPPDIPLVVSDPMRLQEGEEFLLQGNRAVVLLLVAEYTSPPRGRWIG